MSREEKHLQPSKFGLDLVERPLVDLACDEWWERDALPEVDVSPLEDAVEALCSARPSFARCLADAAAGRPMVVTGRRLID